MAKKVEKEEKEEPLGISDDDEEKGHARRGTRCGTKKKEKEREKKKREARDARRRRESGRMDGWMALVKRKIARSSFHIAVPDVSKPGNLAVRSKA